MKQQEVFKKIGGILKELNDQYEYLNTTDFPLNELELELFLANSNFLTDHVLIISKLNAQNAEVKETPVAKVEEPPVIKNEAPREPTYFEPLVSRITQPEPQNKAEENLFESYKTPAKEEASENPVPSIDLETASPAANYSYIREEEPETIRHELILDDVDLDEDESVEDAQDKTNEEDIIELPPVQASPTARYEPEPIKVEQPETVDVKPEIVFEEEPVKPEVPAEKPYTSPEPTVQKDVLTINERISAQMGAKQGVAEQLHTQTISDLKQAINLNDKLLFVKDLFNGYSLAYSEAIEILNRFTSYAQAEQFLKNNYVAKNHWDSKPEATEKFYALLKRRYA